MPKRDQLGGGRPVPETGKTSHVNSFSIMLVFQSGAIDPDAIVKNQIMYFNILSCS